MEYPGIVKEFLNIDGAWAFVSKDRDGNIVDVRLEKPNVITDLFRNDLLEHVVGLSTLGGPWIYLGVGDNNTAADAAQTALVNELIGNASRITCTGPAAGPFAVATDTGTPPYRKKVILEGVFPATDGNDGSNFWEFALFTSATFATGDMLNRFVLGSALPKINGISITALTTLRS